MASLGIVGLSRPLTVYLNLMNIDGVGMGLIPACSWHQAQQPQETDLEYAQRLWRNQPLSRIQSG